MPKATITRITPVTDRIAEIRFVPEGGVPDWTPGAHVDVDTAAGKRSYSLIAWPEQRPGEARDDLCIAVQREDEGEGGSKAMHGLAEGDEITLSDPANDFELTGGDGRVTLLAGGIGVTPLISMATAMAAAGRDFTFHYSGRSAGIMAFRERLTETFGDRVQVHTDDAAPMDLKAIAEAAKGGEFYICGPKGMIDAARAAAETAGIAGENIHVELFTTATAGADDQPFEVEIASSGEVITVPAGQSIIEALEAAGHDLIYDCQRGDCGICQTDVLEGVPDHRDVVLSQSERDAGNVMQICVSRAKTPRLKLDL